jgi:hypothetical protein
MAAISSKKIIPQLIVDGKYIGVSVMAAATAALAMASR